MRQATYLKWLPNLTRTPRTRLELEILGCHDKNGNIHSNYLTPIDPIFFKFPSLTLCNLYFVSLNDHLVIENNQVLKQLKFTFSQIPEITIDNGKQLRSCVLN